MARIGIYVLFFVSGISGLVYQVVWVRQFGNLFGNTVHSAALVTAVFMLGLGVGCYLAGLWADRVYRRDPRALLKLYAYFELGIALLGQLIAVALPRLEPLSARFASYVQNANGWYELSFSSQLLSYSLAVVLILPITTLMGGTLTLLIRHLIRSDLSLAGWRVGALYGVNTAGASLGAFLVDFSLVPQLGLLATQSIAVFLNLGVGLIALSWAARSSAPHTETAEIVGNLEAGSEASSGKLVAATSTVLFLTGFCAMGMEILWFRYLTTVLGSHRATFSLLLTVILTGIWVGSVFGAALNRRFGRPVLLYMITQTAFVAISILLFWLFEPSRLEPSQLLAAYAASSTTVRRFVEVWAQLRVILLVVGIPAFLMGFAYPLANANIQRVEGLVATRAGALYLANVVGAVLGVLITGFLLLPDYGMQVALVVLAACGILALVPMWVSLDRRSGSLTFARAVAVACASVGGLAWFGWISLPQDHLATRLFRPVTPTERTVTFSEGINESIVITEDLVSGLRRLYTNGYSMSGTDYAAQRYMRAFAHVPLLGLDSPEKVLVICFGVGNTLNAASLHPSVSALEVVDLSEHVLGHASYFASWNRNVLDDPRVSVYVNDGRQHLRMQPEAVYDLVTLEPPPIGQAGVASLYSREFYELVRSRLRDGGYLTQWLPAYQLPGPLVASMVRAFVDVFPDAVLLSGYRSELILMGRNGLPPALDPIAIEARLKGRDAVLKDLQRIDMGTPTEIIGTFAGSSASLERTSRESPAVTDDYPIMEYGPITFRQTAIPSSLFETEAVDQFCPSCFEDQSPAPQVRHLNAYLASLGALYESEAFRVTSDLGPIRPTPLNVRADPGEIAEALASSHYLQQMFERE